MKLHRNRKKNNFKKFISLVLVCCMTLSMGSSYVSAGEIGAATENGGAVQESLEAAESVPAQTEGEDSQDAGSGAVDMEEAPSDEKKSMESGDEGQETPSDAEQQEPSVDADGQPSGDENQDAADASSDETSNGGNQQTQPSGDAEQEPSAEESKTPDAGSDNKAGQDGAANGGNGEQGSDSSQPGQDGTFTNGNSGSESQQPASESGTDGTGLNSDMDGLEAEFDGMEFGAELTEEEMMAIYEELVAFEELPEDEVGSVTYPDLGMGTFSMVGGQDWSFDVYYVNQSDPNHVEMTKDFNLKYQMEFHAGKTIPAKQVIIRIPKALFMQRDEKTPVDYSDIAVNRVENINSDPIPSRSTPFNYYIEGDDIVFFNYTEIASGTNAAWQVLYKNVKLMKLVDETEWSLQAAIKVGDEEKKPAPLTGKIDSYVKINSADKTAFRDTDKVVTPELYTQKQVGDYIEGGQEAIPEQIKKNFDKYVYMLWSVTASGTANQRWTLSVSENPAVEGNVGEGPCVVGYKNNTNSTYRLPLTIEKKSEGEGADLTEWYEAGIKDNETENWGTRFWVVTAYPKSMVYDDEGKLKNNTLVNNITVSIKGDIDSDYREITRKWTYREYKWEYTGKYLDVDKKSDETINDPKDYMGWIELNTALGKEKDGYGGIPFHTVGSFDSFEPTHNVTNPNREDYGKYIPGTAAELTTVDDIMYLRLETAGIKDGDGILIPTDYILTRDDYYYSSVTVTQKDVGFNMLDPDVKADPESLADYDTSTYGDDFNQDVYIYAMFAKDKNFAVKTTAEDPQTDWELVGEKAVQWDDSGVMTYNFTPDEIRREPYRVKVVHKTINYRTTCNIDVEVFIKKSSPTIQRIIAAFDSSVKDADNLQVTGDTVLQMKFEDLSGVWGQKYSNGTKFGNVMQDTTVSSFNYESYKNDNPEMDLEKESKRLHEQIRPYRHNATKLVTGLAKEAHAYKYSSEVENDAAKERGMVNYYLTAYDGYKIYSRSAMNYLMGNSDSEKLKPGRQNVVFYDLLPYGMHFDYNAEVVAGQLDNLSGGYYRTEDSYWNKSAVKEIKPEDVEVIDNYRETGRTLVVIPLTYNGSDSSIYSSENNLWMEGWGVKFGAYFEWKDQAVIREGANVFAFMPDKKDPRYATMDLCGTLAQVACDDGDLSTISASDRELYKDLVKPDPAKQNALNGDINGDDNKAGDTDISMRRNVLYAHNVITDEIATAGMSEFEKTVRASDNSGFGKSAVVNPGDFYTYAITIRAKAELSDIVIIDRLEHAKEDRSGEGNYNYQDAVWKGNFDSIITTALVQKGITPVVYYRIGEVGELDEIEQYSHKGNVTADDTVVDFLEREAAKVTDENPITSATKGWVSKEDYDKAANRPSVKAVAVYLMHTDEKSETTAPYTLTQGESVTLQIRMKAPEWDNILTQAGLGQETDVKKQLNNYAYNNPYYYATLKAGGTDSEGNPMLKTEGLLPGETVSVSASPYGSLEVFKEFGENVPDSEANTPFRMRLYWEKEGEEPVRVYTEGAGKIYELYKKTAAGTWEMQQKKETDPDGYFTLSVNEKAVFTDNLPDVANAKIEEDLPDVFWEEEPEIGYNQKTESDLVEKGTQNITVTNKFRPVLYVQKILDGIPQGAADRTEVFTFQLRVAQGEGGCQPLGGIDYYIVGEDGNLSKKGTTVSEDEATDEMPAGTFQIREGEKLAFFPGKIGIRYELEELPGDSWKWICAEENNTKTGTIEQNSTTAEILNYYRFKDIYLTKKLTHWVPDTPGEECTQVFKFQVFQVDSSDQEHPVTTRNEWQLYEADENGRLKLDADNNPIPVTGDGTSGTLMEDGIFEAACAGKIVKISGLELAPGTRDAIYVIREVNSGDEYRPVNDFCEFVIHDSDESVRGTITNDYLYRPLSVTKMVLYDYSDGPVDPTTKDFKMKVQVETDGEGLQPLAGKAYTVKKDGEVIGSGETNEKGEFTLKDGQTATFEKAGKLGQSFTVSEVQDVEFPQIRTGAVYPDSGEPGGEISTEVGQIGKYGDPYHGTLSGDTNEAAIINGNGEYLLIRKEYEGADPEGSAWIELMKEVNPSNLRAYFYLEVTEAESDEPVLWPRERDVDSEGYVTVTSVKADGTIDNNARWYRNDWGSEYEILPGETVIIPLSKLSEVKSYTLHESNQHRLADKGDGTYYQISQKEPANDAGYPGILETDRMAVICNEVRYVEPKGKTVYKWMDVGSDEVPVGAELVWKLEKYTEEGWQAACNVEYLSFDGNGITCKEVLHTGEEDGKIVLTKGRDTMLKSGFPYIQFVGENVNPQLNLYESGESVAIGTYRLTELQEESSGWGKLAGYGKADPIDLDNVTGTVRIATDGRTSNLYSYGMDVSGEDTVAFVNSNRTDTVEIEKQMRDGTTSSTDRFTMILKQVVSATVGSDGQTVYSTIPAANVTYQLYSVKTPGGPIEVEGDTEIPVGDGGEIYLRAGQYAKLQLPDKTQWIVSEKERDGYSLYNLTPEQSSTKLRKLGDNEMLINPSKGDIVPVGLTVTKVKEQNAVNLVPGRKWWRVNQGDKLTKSDFEVYSVSSDGSKVKLEPDDFEIGQPILDGLTQNAGIYPIEVTWKGKTTTAEISVIGEGTLTSEMVQGSDPSYKYFAERNSIYEPLAVQSGDVYIPEYIAGGSGEAPESITVEYRITEIDDSAYRGNDKVRSITAPYVTKVKGNAFMLCENLTTVNLSSAETIGGGVFQDCKKLTDVNLPKATTIGYQAFYNCEQLSSISLQEAVTIGGYAFNGCKTLSSIDLPKATSIGNNAFQSDPLVSIDLPNAITIGESAFETCAKLSSINLPKATTIGKKAFYKCSQLVNVELPEAITIGESAFSAFSSSTKLSSINLPKAITIGREAFYGCNQLVDVELPEAINISDQAFYICSKLSKVDLPKAETIGRQAFQNSGLVSVNLPNAKVISYRAFRNVSSLKKVNLPIAETIGDEVFSGCDMLESVYLPSAKSLGKDIFRLNSGNKKGHGNGVVITLRDINSIDGDNVFYSPNSTDTTWTIKVIREGASAFLQECVNEQKQWNPRETQFSIKWEYIDAPTQ